MTGPPIESPAESPAEEIARLRAETERLNALLAGREHVFRECFAAAPLGMAILSAEPPRYLEVNEAFTKFVGRSREHILAADPYVFWAEITHPDDFAVEQTHLARLVAGEIDRYDLRKRFIRPNGESRWGLIGFSAIRNGDGSLQYGIVQIADVHDRVTQEEHTLQSGKLQAIGQLAGGIAHDFNNLLTVMMGYAGLLKAELAADDPKSDFAGYVLESAERGADLTRQLLAYGRRQVLLPKVFSVSQGVASVCDLVGRLVGEQIEFARGLRATGHIEADPGQVEQVVMNLVLNARDALPHGGRLTVETDDVDVAADGTINPDNDGTVVPSAEISPGRYVRIRVSDEGTGMSDEVRAHIFEPFFTTKDASKGTGLGLSTVWGIVSQSGGCITVASVPGRGSRFDVYFRRVEAPVTAAVARTVGQSPHRDATILLAEDNPAVRQLLSGVLRSAGYTVLSADTAQRAHDLAQSNDVDLVISDMVMPRHTGLALIQELRRDRPELPVLIVSGYTEQAAVLAESLTEAHYLFKPFVPEVLIERVRQILG